MLFTYVASWSRSHQNEQNLKDDGMIWDVNKIIIHLSIVNYKKSETEYRKQNKRTKKLVLTIGMNMKYKFTISKLYITQFFSNTYIH